MWKTLRIVAVLCCAVVFGLTLSHVLQGPGSRGLDGPSWLQVQHTFYGGFAVVGGLAEVVGVIATTALAVALRRSGAQWWPAVVATVCLLGTLFAYGWGNRPVNTLVTGWTASTLPADWAVYRDQWEAAHAASAVLSGIALTVLVLTMVGGGADGSSRQASPTALR